MKTNKYKGIIAIILSALTFAVMAVFIKLAGDLPSIQKSLFRNVISMIFVGSLLIRNRISLKGIKHYKLLTLRAILGTIGVVVNFYAIDALTLSDANVIQRLSTFFLLIFSFLFLNEKVSFKQLLAIIFAFLGVSLIIKPQFNVEVIPYLIAIFGAICGGAAYTALRALGKKEHPLIVVFYFSVFSTVFLTPFAIYYFEPMTMQQFAYLIIAGVFATFGQFGITYGYKFAPASEISIYNFTGVIFSTILGYFIFEQTQDFLSYIGYLIIFVSSFTVFLDKKRM